MYCDCCPGKKIFAIKMCLKCEVSMCKEHVKEHQELPVFTGHPLVRPLGDLQERKCPQHDDEVLRYYCNSSRRYLCNLCALEKKQQNHESEASTVLRRQLTVSLNKQNVSGLTNLTPDYPGDIIYEKESSSGTSFLEKHCREVMLWRNWIF